MQFSSLDFILRFLPVFLILYYLVPKKYKNFILVAGSLVFYGFYGIWNFLIVIGLLLFNFAVSMAMKKRNRFLLAVTVTVNVLALIYCKLSGTLIPGISFIVFEMIALLVDAYHQKSAVNSFGEYAVYTTFFPKLISGPIMKYSEMKERIHIRNNSFENVEAGLGTFLLGLSYKVILADSLAGIFRAIQTIGVDAISTPMAWLGMLGYSLQIYFDFQGYTLMAIGLGKMVGFTLPENFDEPYAAKTISQFYRRWHMTLGRWFKDYVYFPLGGSRKSKAKTVFNLLVVWLLTSVWHGISIHFLLWGMSICILIILEKLVWGKWLEKTKILSHLYVCLLIPMSWMLFILPNLREIKTFFACLFGVRGEHVNTADFLKYGKLYWIYIVVALIFTLPKTEKFLRKNMHKWWAILLLVAGLWISVYFLKVNVDNPFLYSYF